MAGRQALTFSNITSLLKNAPLGEALGLPALQKAGYGLEFVPSESGGAFTGQVVANVARTTPGILDDPAFHQFLGVGALIGGGALAAGPGLTTLQSLALKAGQTGITKFIESRQPRGGTPMAFEDGDTGFGFGDFFSGVGKVLQGGFGQNLLGVGTQALSGFVQNQFAPQPVSFQNPFQTSMAAVPSIARGGAMVARGFFNRFPSLATGIQALRNKGANVSRSSLYSLMKRFGPDFLIGGGILTAAAVSELAMAGPGRRRMNPGNVKALRRAHRRMKAFHHVCTTNDRMLGGRRSKRRSVPFAGTSITQLK